MQQNAHLERKAYERSSGDKGFRNGFNHRTITTKVGNLSLSIPQVRDSEQTFKPFIPGFEQGCRINCEVKRILEKLCGCQVSATYVSQCSEELDEMLESWRTRTLAPLSHLFLDATYFKLRRDNQVTSCALLVAIC